MVLTAAVIAFSLSDAAGLLHSSAELGQARATVFAFIAPQCPISNAYAPELGRIAAEYGARGVRFFGVQADPSITGVVAREHARAYGLSFPILLDPAQQLVKQVGVTHTLELAVVDASGHLRYRGRLDDRNANYGEARPRATRQDLRIAIDEILAGREVSVKETKALGCTIPALAAAARGAVTFARDVAPILYRACADCHRPGESAPFPLLTYADVAPRAPLIATVTSSGYMPPWLPAAGPPHFEHERRLTAKEIATLRTWADSGAPEGDRSRTPPVPRAPSASLGEPDLQAAMRAETDIPADGPDQYRCFVVPAATVRDRDRSVRAIEIRPGNRRVVHHAILFQDLTGTARKRDAGAGYACFGSPGFLPARGLGGWTPGSPPIRLPEDMPETLYRGGDLVLQIHYHPTGKPERDRTGVALYFTERKPARRMLDVALGSTAIDIPPGERDYRVRDHFTLPVAVDARGVIPHAHYVCRVMRAWAVLPDGTKRTLLNIPHWNFDWQDQYRYRTPLRLPAGTRVEMEFSYDNSTANVRNPNHPPARVLYGAGSGDEMAGLHLQVTPVDPDDADELGQALWGKMMRSLGGGIYRAPR